MSTNVPLRVAIVGSGPSGFYAADALLNADAHVDMFDRLPTPYGMVRGGVAPDHHRIKEVTQVYRGIAERPHFRFFGNLKLGQSIELDELRNYYHATMLAIGNERHRDLPLEGIDRSGYLPAASLVGWYNGHPDFHDLAVDLSGVRRVAVVGNGNVAIDVARVLARNVDQLRPTDIADHALFALTESGVTDIFVLGRRGPVQAAFSPNELKELGKLDDVEIVIRPEELELDHESQRLLDESGARSPLRKNFETLQQLAGARRGARRRIHFRFLVSPETIREDGERITGLTLRHNALAAAEGGRLAARPTEHREELDIDLLIPAIGYRGIPVPGVPFDQQTQRIRNQDGRVCDENGQPLPGVYTVGWAQRGPHGLIGSHKKSSRAVVSLLLDDDQSGLIVRRELPDGAQTFDARGATHFSDWQHLDQVERERGQFAHARRRKITAVGEMLDTIKGK